jgi:hypothetical protein
MTIRVIYSTGGFFHKNAGLEGKQCEDSFTSLEAAKAAPFPEGYEFAFIQIEGGYHEYSAKFGWKFHKKE